MSTAAASLGDGAAGLRHLAIIMDGNGRWAKARRLPRIAGHRAGVEAVRRVVEAAPDLGIEVLTLYAFSSENWKRPADEVADLMGLLRHYIQSEINALHKNGVRLDFIGNYRALKPDLVAMLDAARVKTAGNTRLTLIMALNYGGQDEMMRAAKSLARDVAAGTLSPEAITVETLAARLDTAALPPPDLVLRTSGEMRLSNFLLWQSAYAEFVATDTLWPDFNAQALADAVAEFATRERRFGGR
ncbi:isoprenyl transferase [Polymorphobacter fuscus]|uniref:Isoprenyl transferase n=1 Tax=Sandarakinorhabdus fusca TaxID=1439888 RepID=A0A7C9GWG3_9SPHN|nr:isoprenyl transferase [Polymorphobacter fuscus]KAB7648960.1 isoprenyl transferase [Polymorphobacter fuscus]MQT16554.1 isoprenyl transferase [Polymorphobacter fuscus]NJC07155.1 undecaprenyl diphosphate synthase [Polymorphobacter fuscus]